MNSHSIKKIIRIIGLVVILCFCWPVQIAPSVVLGQESGPGSKQETEPQSPLSPQSPDLTFQVGLVGQIRGSTEAVAIQGNFAYIGIGPRLVILNISDPAHPVFVGKTAVLPGIVWDISISGSYAYVAAESGGLRIINISNPAAPTEAGFYDTPGYAYGVAISGSYAYVADSGSGLQIINITNPAIPTLAGVYDTLGYAFGVAVSGSYAYVADSTSGLQIINITNPAIPTFAGVYNTLGSAYGVAVSGSYAYVADYDKGLQIINITNPAIPTLAGSYIPIGYVFGVTISGSYAYVANGGGGLRIINITNPVTPSEVGFYDTPGYSNSVAISGNYAYVADETRGVRIINITNLSAPSEVGFYATSGYARGLAVSGSYAYVADSDSGLMIIDITNPSAPSEVGFYDTPGYAYDVAISGSYAYVADEYYSLRIINITNPAAPTEEGFYITPDLSYGVAVSGSYAYVADKAGGLQIINITNPALPTLAGSYDTLGNAYDVAVSGSYAYVADETGGLRIINITNPANPTLAGSYDTQGNAYGVAVSGGYAYIADDYYGLRIINITNPAAPTEAGFYVTPGYAYAVAVSGSYAYVADYNRGLSIINITNPASPTLAGFYETPGFASGIVKSGNYLYLADRPGGLFILSKSCTIPGAPVLVAPADGSTSNTRTPLFDWNAASDATEYQLQVDNNSDFTSPVVDVTTTATDYTPIASLIDATYYWQVRGRNAASECSLYGAYSASRSFTVTGPPLAFNKLLPSNGGAGLSLNPTLSWEASTGATGYQYCFDTTNDNACSSWISVGTSTSVSISGLSGGIAYYWHVRASNAYGTIYSNGNGWWNFATNDTYEPDNTDTQAKSILPGILQNHSIYPAGDVDWVKFILSEESAVYLQTNGPPPGDTQMWLYNSSQGLIEVNDDNLPSTYSLIDRTCSVDTLPAGTYFVKVEEFGGNDIIPTYTLSFTTRSCHVYLPLVLKNYVAYFEGPLEQEENDSSAQANGPLHSGRDYYGKPDDTEDYFSFITTQNGTIDVSLINHTGGGVQMMLYYQSTAQRVEPVCQKGDAETSCSKSYPNRPPGLYYLRIYTPYNNNQTQYTLRITYP